MRCCQCRYVRKLRLQDGASPTLLALAPGPGMLIAHSWADLGLHVFSINGSHLVSATGNERLSAIALSASGHFLLTGGLRGVVSLHWLHSLEVSWTRSLSVSRAIYIHVALLLHFKYVMHAQSGAAHF